MKQIRTLLSLFLVCAILAAGQSPAALAAESSREGDGQGPLQRSRLVPARTFLASIFSLQISIWLIWHGYQSARISTSPSQVRSMEKVMP